MKLLFLFALLFAQTPNSRTISGMIVTAKDESVGGVSVTARFGNEEKRALANEDGEFRLDVPDQAVTLQIERQHVRTRQVEVATTGNVTDLRIEVEFVIPPIHQSLVITTTDLDPTVATYNDEVYRKALFSRN